MKNPERSVRIVWTVGYIAALLLFSGAIWVKGHELSSNLSSEGALVCVVSIIVMVYWGAKWNGWFP